MVFSQQYNSQIAISITFHFSIIFLLPCQAVLDILLLSLLDSTRAGKYKINAETYANTALRCSRYLFNFHLRSQSI